jgi:hypothetical protein
VGHEPFRAIEFTGAREFAQNPQDTESDWDEMMDIEYGCISVSGK